MSTSPTGSQNPADTVALHQADTASALVLRLPRFLGRRVLFALAINMLGSITLGVIELLIALFLQLFLQRIGVINQPIRLPSLLRTAQFSAASLTLGLFVIAIVRGVGQFLTLEGAIRALETTNARLRRLAVYEMLLHPSRRSVAAATINARVGEVFPKAAYCCYFAATLIGALVQGAVLALIMMVVDWRESLVAIAGIGLVGLVVLRLNRGTRRAANRVPAEQQALSVGIERVARNTLLVRALRTERREHARFVASIEAYAKHSTRAGTLGALATALTPVMGIMLVLVLVALSRHVLHTPGLLLLSFLYLFIRFTQNLAVIVQMFSQVNQFLPQFNEAFAYFRAFERADLVVAFGLPAADPIGPSRAVTGVEGEAPPIEIRDLHFRYPGATRDALHSISAAIPGGSQFAIVGPSGCGKSTLLGLMLGLFRASGGSVTIGGRSPEDFFGNPAARIGYVGAEPFLIAGSVRENLCYGLRHAVDEAAIDRALDEAHIRAVVDALPGRLEYAIGEDGAGLSAGQKQRLCLARALLVEPQLLVLDEASANLDAATEREIADSLRVLRGRCTTIIVSHREGILKHADHVLELGRDARAADEESVA